MTLVHFVVHRHAEEPLCGQRDGNTWMESSRADAVTCPACWARLAGMRRDEQQQQAVSEGP